MAPPPSSGQPRLGVPLDRNGTPTDGTQLPNGQVVQLQAVDDLGALMAKIQQAAAQGHLQLDTQRFERGVSEILEKHGYDADGGDPIQITDPKIQAEIMQELRQHAQGQTPGQGT